MQPETPESPQPEAVKQNWPGTIYLASSFALMVIAYAVSRALFAPLRLWETVVAVLVFTSPIWIIFAQIIYEKLGNFPAHVRRWQIKIFIHISCVLLSISGTFFMNAQFDTSDEQICQQIVSAKHSERHKGSTSYYAVIPTCTPPLFDFLNIDQNEVIHVSSQKKYNLIQPGITQAEITFKSGRYHIPWKVSSRVFVSADSSRAKPPVPAYLARFHDALNDPDYLLGLSYYKGESEPKDIARAIEHYKIAADRGNAAAQYDLAYIYYYGVDVPKDTSTATLLIQKSAMQGYAVAQDYLGVMYGDGIDGAPQDWVQSYVWIARAAAQGFDQAIKDLEYAKAHMNAQQLEAAKQLLQNEQH